MPKLKLESLLLVVFFASVILLGYRKCAANRASYVNKDMTENVDYSVDRPVRTDSLAGIETGVAPKPQTYSAPPIKPSTAAPPNTNPITSVPAVPKTAPPPTDVSIPPTQNTTIPSTTVPTTPAKIKPPTTKPSIAQPAKAMGAERSILYITIDRLKIRKEPGLKGKTLGRLKLHEKVYFAGERTDYKQEISLGYVMANEPWIKVETQRGTIGWVYGAGVDIMKTVREGVRQ